MKIKEKREIIEILKNKKTEVYTYIWEVDELQKASKNWFLGIFESFFKEFSITKRENGTIEMYDGNETFTIKF